MEKSQLFIPPQISKISDDMLLFIYAPYAVEQGMSNDQARLMAVETESEAVQQFLADVKA